MGEVLYQFSCSHRPKKVISTSIYSTFLLPPGSTRTATKTGGTEWIKRRKKAVLEMIKFSKEKDNVRERERERESKRRVQKGVEWVKQLFRGVCVQKIDGVSYKISCSFACKLNQFVFQFRCQERLIRIVTGEGFVRNVRRSMLFF